MNTRIKMDVGGVPEHFNLPWHLACESGAFATAGLAVNFHDYPGGTGALMRGLAEKQLDVALVLMEGAVSEIVRGSSARLVKVFVNSPLVWGIHVAADSDIQTVNDVRGRKYAISRHGSGSHLMAIVDASQRGWETQSLEFVVVGDLTGARRALPRNEADVFLWEKFMTKPYVDNGEFRRIACSTAGWPSFVVAVREDVLADHPAALRDMLTIVEQQSAELMADPQGPELIAERYGLRPEDAREWFQQTEWAGGFCCPTAELTQVLRFLHQLKIADASAVEPKELWFDLNPARS